MSLKKIKSAKKVLEGFIVLLTSLLLAVIAYQNIAFGFIRKLEVKSYEKQPLFQTQSTAYRERVSIKAMLDDTFNFPYFYFEKDFSQDEANGRAIPQFVMVFVDKNINFYEYTTTLAHEIAHCKFYAVDECYTEFKAIVTLIESDYEWLINVGKVWANDVLTYQKTEYDCGYYLLQYFNERM